VQSRKVQQEDCRYCEGKIDHGREVMIEKNIDMKWEHECHVCDKTIYRVSKTQKNPICYRCGNPNLLNKTSICLRCGEKMIDRRYCCDTCEEDIREEAREHSQKDLADKYGTSPSYINTVVRRVDRLVGD